MRRKRRIFSEEYPDWKLKSFLNFKVRKKLPLPTVAPYKIDDYNEWDYDGLAQTPIKQSLDNEAAKLDPGQPKQFYIKVRPEYIFNENSPIVDEGLVLDAPPSNIQSDRNYDAETLPRDISLVARSPKVSTEPVLVLNEYDKLDDVPLAEYLQTLSNNALGLNNKVLLPALFAVILFLALSNCFCLSYCIFKRFCRRKAPDISIPRFPDPALKSCYEVTRSDYEEAFSTDENGICKLYGLTIYDKISKNTVGSHETPVDLSTAIAPLVCTHRPCTEPAEQPVSLDTKTVINSGNQTELIYPKVECKYVQIPDVLLQPIHRPQETWADQTLAGLKISIDQLQLRPDVPAKLPEQPCRLLPRLVRPFTEQEGIPFTDEAGRPFTDQAGRPFTDQAGRPFTDQAGRPFTDQAGRPFTDQAGRPFTDQAGRPFTDQAGRPITDQAGKPFTDQAGRPFTDQAGSPFTDQAGRPFTDQAGRPFTDQAGRPFTDQAERPFIDQAGRPFTDQAGRPFTDQAGRPFTDQAGRPFTNQVGRPFTDQAGRPFTDQAGRPFADQAGRPFADQAGRPLTDQAGRPLTEPPEQPLPEHRGKTLPVRPSQKHLSQEMKPGQEPEEVVTIKHEGKHQKEEEKKKVVTKHQKTLKFGPVAHSDEAMWPAAHTDGTVGPTAHTHETVGPAAHTHETVGPVPTDDIEHETEFRLWMKKVFVDPAIYEMMPVINKDEGDMVKDLKVTLLDDIRSIDTGAPHV